MFWLLSHFASSGAIVQCPPGQSGTCSTGLPPVGAGSTELHHVLQVVFGLVALISVLMIVIGGLKFVTSDGNPQNATKARETIIFAVVGLIVALLAEGLVTFVLSSL